MQVESPRVPLGIVALTPMTAAEKRGGLRHGHNVQTSASSGFGSPPFEVHQTISKMRNELRPGNTAVLNYAVDVHVHTLVHSEGVFRESATEPS